jgi:hypothetical protein
MPKAIAQALWIHQSTVSWRNTQWRAYEKRPGAAETGADTSGGGADPDVEAASRTTAAWGPAVASGTVVVSGGADWRLASPASGLNRMEPKSEGGVTATGVQCTPGAWRIHSR